MMDGTWPTSTICQYLPRCCVKSQMASRTIWDLCGEVIVLSPECGISVFPIVTGQKLVGFSERDGAMSLTVSQEGATFLVFNISLAKHLR